MDGWNVFKNDTLIIYDYIYIYIYIIYSSLEDKLHVFAPTCGYVFIPCGYVFISRGYVFIQLRLRPR